MEDTRVHKLIIIIYLTEKNGRPKKDIDNTGKVKFYFVETHSVSIGHLLSFTSHCCRASCKSFKVSMDVTPLKRRERSFKFYLWEAIKCHMVCSTMSCYSFGFG